MQFDTAGRYFVLGLIGTAALGEICVAYLASADVMHPDLLKNTYETWEELFEPRLWPHAAYLLGILSMAYLLGWQVGASTKQRRLMFITLMVIAVALVPMAWSAFVDTLQPDPAAFSSSNDVRGWLRAIDAYAFGARIRGAVFVLSLVTGAAAICFGCLATRRC